MKRSLKILKASGNVEVSIACPAGKKVRIVSVFVATNVTTDGEDVSLSIGVKNETLVRTTTGGMVLSQGIACFTIGGNPTPINIAVIDPVTGVVAFDQNLQHATGSVPDLEWDFSPVIVLGTSGSVGAWVVLYEEIEP